MVSSHYFPCYQSAYADIFSAMKKTTQIFKSLADETRLRILLLLGDDELCVCDLMAILHLPQSTISRHLAYLRNAGFVEDRRQGVWMYYRLASRAELHRDLLDLLKTHGQGLPMVQQDRIGLASHVRGKGKLACS
jgi:ArsR family transcriptional regulator